MTAPGRQPRILGLDDTYQYHLHEYMRPKGLELIHTFHGETTGAPSFRLGPQDVRFGHTSQWIYAQPRQALLVKLALHEWQLINGMMSGDWEVQIWAEFLPGKAPDWHIFDLRLAGEPLGCLSAAYPSGVQRWWQLVEVGLGMEAMPLADLAALLEHALEGWYPILSPGFTGGLDVTPLPPAGAVLPRDSFWATFPLPYLNNMVRSGDIVDRS